ncbi:MAG: hypothetical protein QOI11_3098 [Candidatus Eremiobacteraeota bacterium]|nr:hypothetical protein [Candidatus Eremiobacteraeota bacterium]
MLALLALLAALSPEPQPAPPSLSPLPRIVRVVEVRLSSLETRLRADAPPSRFRDLAKVLVERARVRLAAGDAAAADQLGAAATDTLRAERPLVLILQMPPGTPGPQGPLPFGVVVPRLPGPPPEGFEIFAPPAPRAHTISAADRAARHLDHAGAMLAMTAGFAERGDAAKLLGLARTALDDARKALAANDARSADGGARRAETLARAALHAAIADDPALRMLPSLPPLPHRLPVPPSAPVPPGELP